MLLRKVQAVAALFHDEGLRTPLPAVVETLHVLLDQAGVILTARRGRLMAWALPPSLQAGPLDAHSLEAGQLPDHLAAAVLKVDSPVAGSEADALTGVAHSAIVPVKSGGRRVGTLLLLRPDVPFTDEDLALAQVAALGAGLVIAAALTEEAEGEATERQRARAAVRSLSYSEAVAVQHLLDELQGDEGLLVASRVADRAGITRSIVVNALRKLASASVIEARSLGAKGTYLRVLNRELRRELSRQRVPRPDLHGVRRRASTTAP